LRAHFARAATPHLGASCRHGRSDQGASTSGLPCGLSAIWDEIDLRSDLCRFVEPVAGFRALAVTAPARGKAHSSAQLKKLGTLLPGHSKRAAITILYKQLLSPCAEQRPATFARSRRASSAAIREFPRYKRHCDFPSVRLPRFDSSVDRDGEHRKHCARGDSFDSASQ
jgi:hypothetical protein